LGVQNRQNQIIKFINSKKIISFNRVRGRNKFYYGIAKKWGFAYTSRASSAASQTFLLRVQHPSERFLFNRKFRKIFLLNKNTPVSMIIKP